jgi:hypothetical protein
MNWLEKISYNAFINELNKLAKLDTDKKGDIIYRSEQEENTNQIKQDPKSPYECFSEDSAFGYKIAAIVRGRKYPSEEMKKEYDAANDSEHFDLDSVNVISPKYPVEPITTGFIH